MPDSVTERVANAVLRRDRAMLLGGAAGIGVIAWAWVLRMPSAGLDPHAGHHHSGGAGYPALFLMWAVMMVAMMLPAVAPYVLALAAEHRRLGTPGTPVAPAAIFLAGYFTVWSLFCALAALAQQALSAAGLLSSAMAATSGVFAGGLLVGAGLYQWTPMKNACLRHCRSPLGVLLHGWHDGRWGSFRMGLEHGAFCLGCCWMLMCLPFAAGVMNILWMAALTAFLLVEKAAPGGEWVGRFAGGALIVSGVWILTATLR